MSAPDFVAILNPISGGGSAPGRWAEVDAELRRRGVNTEIVESISGAHAAQVARDAAASGAVVVAVGGDGQIRDVAAGVVAAGTSVLGIVPAGRGNDLARHLGITADPIEIADTLIDGRRRDLDVLAVGESIAVGNVYVGLDSVATELINRLRWMGTLAYRIAPVLAGLLWRPARFTFVVDGKQSQSRAHLVVIANSGWYGNGLHMVPSAQADDGRIDMLIVDGGASRLVLMRAMGEAKRGAHVSRTQVRTVTAQTIGVSADRAIPVHSDGDYLQELPVDVQIRPAVLPVLVPRT